MPDYLILLAIATFAVILYVMFYNEFVFMPKVKKVELANEFRYARNLNTELIHLFRKYELQLQNAGNIFDGLTYNVVADQLQAWHDKVYTDDTFKILVSQEKKANRYVIDDLQADIFEHIKMQHQVKANFSRAISQVNLAAA
ncbi:hypothetical protein ACFGVR_10515 [Mucilaginibacter sp. AW1-3]